MVVVKVGCLDEKLMLQEDNYLLFHLINICTVPSRTYKIRVAGMREPRRQ